MPPPKSSTKATRGPLSRADEILMIVLLVLGDNAYSSSIQAELWARARKKVSVGSLWVTLDQLAERELIEKHSIKEESRKGGRPRIYYRVTPAGKAALKAVQEFQVRLWKDIPDLG